VSYSLPELLTSVVVSTAHSELPEVSLNVSSESAMNSTPDRVTWVTKYDDTFGRCFSMQLGPAITALGVIDVVFTGRLGIYVYLHHPGQKMDVDSKTKVKFCPFVFDCACNTTA